MPNQKEKECSGSAQQKLIVNVGLARRIVRIWEDRVNTLLLQGWKVVDHKLEKRGLRLLCSALLEKSNT